MISKTYKSDKLFFFAFVALLLINLLQAGFTELMDDEAYYWMYSNYIDWGYYDHPPMVALIIKAGYSIFHNTLGVRLLSVLMVCGCLWMMYKMQTPVNARRFIVISFSLLLIHIGGILAVPDIPLVFFTALFLLVYQSFLKKDTWLHTLLLGLAMAALLYSKYHGILVIAFTFFANIKLIRNYKFRLASILGAVLFLPHLYWQYTHEWPSLMYHLLKRNNAYQFNFTTDYVVGQLFIFGPLIGWMIIYAAIKQKTNGNVWIRTLKWNVTGVFIFFLVSTIRGRIEANWTVMALIPAILLLQYYLESSPKFERILYKLFPYSLVLILLVRVVLVWNCIGVAISKNREMHENKVWTSWVQKKANGYPVYFINSYQMPSKYIFYTGQPATSYSLYNNRGNQFDFWKMDTAWKQDSVLVVARTKLYIVPQDSTKVLLCDSLYCQMFANPNVSADSSMYRQLPARKKMGHK